MDCPPLPVTSLKMDCWETGPLLAQGGARWSKSIGTVEEGEGADFVWPFLAIARAKLSLPCSVLYSGPVTLLFTCSTLSE